MAETTPINEADQRFNSLKSEFNDNWESSCSDLRDYIEPTRGSFDGDNGSRGGMIDHQKVLDGYASIANDILASGLLSGMTSPMRPWFKLAVDDDLFNDEPIIRIWLDDTEKRIRTALNQSNVYQTLYGCYKEIGSFGTGCFMVLEDFEDIIRCHMFTSGEYYLSVDNKGRVNGLAREFYMTVDQIVKEFEYENCSGTVQSNYDNNQRGIYYNIRHLVEDNDYKIAGLPEDNDMKYRSLYWESGNKSGDFLAKRGFKRFNILAPRWETATMSQPYGKGPGWRALGDIKQLQKTTDDKLQLQEKLHRPPTVSDADIEGHINLIPGGNTKASFNVPNPGVRAAYQVPDALNSFIEMNTHLKQNIDKFFFVNLFQMLLNIDNTNMTATEVAERQQEKIMMMGPILHRLQEELLDPLIDIVFSIMLDNGLLLPVPQQLSGMNLRVKYISILAQAQEAAGVNQIARVMEKALAIAQARPDILDNWNFDQIAREINEMEGAPAKIILDEESVLEKREADQQAAQMAQMAQVGKDGGSAIKNLAEANKIAQEAQ